MNFIRVCRNLTSFCKRLFPTNRSTPIWIGASSRRVHHANVNGTPLPLRNRDLKPFFGRQFCHHPSNLFTDSFRQLASTSLGCGRSRLERFTRRYDSHPKTYCSRTMVSSIYING